MMVTSPARTFDLTPTGAFSLTEANAFGFGQRTARAGDRMELAFALDETFEPVGVELTQSADGVVHGALHGEASLDAVAAQVARILSLDHDGAAWEAVLAREAPLAAFASQVPGLRPVLFHSPYEAAAWSIISARIHRAQGAKLRHELAAALGTTYSLHGEIMHAFPSPEALLEGVGSYDGALPEAKRARLVGVARAAQEGLFDVDELQRIGPAAAVDLVQEVKGIGPFYASLIVIRASGFCDVPVAEPRAKAVALEAYGLPSSTDEAGWQALMDRWQPFRTWAAVLCRVAAERRMR